jgi:osmotically-inducible protein OsmY
MGATMRRELEDPDYRWFGLSWAGRPEDREIRSFLLDRLRENPLTRREDIRVGVERGEVTLTGQASSPLVRRSADDDAWITPGVTEVHNHIRVVMIRPAGGEGPQAA